MCASRAHAEVRVRGADFVLVDTGSSNGTLVDDDRIFEYVLGHGDVFRIGDTVIRFELGV